MKGLHLGIGSYYGEVYAYEIEGKYYMAIGNYSGSDYKEISEELFNALIKEYGEPLELDEDKLVPDEEGYVYVHEHLREMQKEVKWIKGYLENEKAFESGGNG